METIRQLFYDLARIDATKGNPPKFPDEKSYMRVYHSTRHHIICDFREQLQALKIELMKKECNV